jgi:hypothetical protein
MSKKILSCLFLFEYHQAFEVEFIECLFRPTFARDEMKIQIHPHGISKHKRNFFFGEKLFSIFDSLAGRQNKKKYFFMFGGIGRKLDSRMLSGWQKTDEKWIPQFISQTDYSPPFVVRYVS